MPVTTFANHKGGVGKTAMLELLAAALAMGRPATPGRAARAPRRVLLIDFDPQGNLSRRLGYTEAELSTRPTMAEAVRDKSPQTLRSTFIPCQWEPEWAERITLAPSRIELEERVSEAGVPGSWLRLREALEGVRELFDDVLIDTPPTLGHLLHLAAVASEHAVAVAAPETDAMRGARRLEDFISQDKNRTALGLGCDLIGVIINGHRSGVADEQEQIDRARARWGDRIWDPVVTLRAPIAGAIERALPPQEAHDREVRRLITEAGEQMADRYLTAIGAQAGAAAPAGAVR